jgi:hypothetical protein
MYGYRANSGYVFVVEHKKFLKRIVLGINLAMFARYPVMLI